MNFLNKIVVFSMFLALSSFGVKADGFRVSSQIGLDGCTGKICKNQGQSVGFGLNANYRVNRISPGLGFQYLILPNSKGNAASGMIVGPNFDFLLSEDFFGMMENLEFNGGINIGYGFFKDFKSHGKIKDQNPGFYDLTEFSGPVFTPTLSFDYYLNEYFALGLNFKYSIFWMNRACSTSFASSDGSSSTGSAKCIPRSNPDYVTSSYFAEDFPDFYMIALDLVFQMGRE